MYSRLLTTLVCIGLVSGSMAAADTASTVTALRLANEITGGFMPTSDPIFQQMVTQVQQGNIQAAATLAAQSPYFANYFARRLALEMQNPQLNATAASDNDATAFLVAHFVGTPTTAPSISSIWSENATYKVSLPTGAVSASKLTLAQIASTNWMTSLVQVPGQTALDAASAAQGTASLVTIPQKHVGGYLTLSSSPTDNSFAEYGAKAGTNLRMIEGVYEIATGLQLLDVASTNVAASETPRFVPEYDPNFFHGQGQTACIACHGGGMASVHHGYATVADVFDFNATLGFTYNSTPTNPAMMKSLASDATKRLANQTCNLQVTGTKAPPVCNPDSVGVDPNQGWNLSTVWGQTGVLQTMGWHGPTSGSGLNALGQALGQSDIVYTFLTKRVVQELCPLGSFSASDITSIAAAANPNASPSGTDDVRTIVSLVASNPSCL